MKSFFTRKDVRAVLAVMAIFAVIFFIVSNAATIAAVALAVVTMAGKAAAIVGSFVGLTKVAPVVAALI